MDFSFLSAIAKSQPRLLVLTSTYPRWQNETEPGFMHELPRRLVEQFDLNVAGPTLPERFGRSDLWIKKESRAIHWFN